MTEQELQAIERDFDRSYDSFCVQCGPLVQVCEQGFCLTCGCDAVGGYSGRATVATLAMPALVAEVRRLREEERQLRGMLDEIKNDTGKSTFAMAISERGQIIVTGPADREEDMAQILTGMFQAISEIGKDKQ